MPVSRTLSLTIELNYLKYSIQQRNTGKKAQVFNSFMTEVPII